MKQTRKPPKIEVRWIDDDDPQAICAIARERLGRLGETWEETLASVYRYMDRTDHVPKVLRVDGKVEGYIFYRLERGLVFIDEIAVRTSRQGYGRRLVRHLLGSLGRLRRKLVAVQVPETNLPAQLFFRSMGFKWFRTVKRKRDREPVYAMKYVAGK